MPLDTSIINVGEYYSSHYLDSTFARDVAGLTQHWRDQGSQSAPRKLQALSQTYFRAKTQALDEENPALRNKAGAEIASWHAHLLQALGYNDLQRVDLPVEGEKRFVPALGRVNRYNRPWLVVCETHFTLPDGSLKEGMPSEDPLGFSPSQAQLSDASEHALCEGDWSRCFARVFTEEDAPRWILFVAGSQILLVDRNTYAQGRYLAFDLDDAFGRKEKDTFNHIAAFVSAETLCPGGQIDEVLLDKLEEQSHRFAHGVTENLQHAVREAIELLINEWAYDRTERQKRNLLRVRPEELSGNGKPITLDLPQLDDGSYEITPEHLKREALVFVYRLLFCFYAEARGGELEILPINDDAYRLGYSLESLRDLEQVPLTAASEDGTYIHEHLKRLFNMIHLGFHPDRDSNSIDQISLGMTAEAKAFVIRPLTATLFSPESTPLLNRARLANRSVQRVIRRLSLSADGRSRTIGRVNYAELGINQLGAVYEGLLSYKGMFADRDLIHVKPAGEDFRDNKTPTWFVSKERLDEFKKDEVERLEEGNARIYTKGTFILHLNSIDREQSASYYTPEVLTRSLVEEALRELLKDYGPADADRLLMLKICEPAMGSGAFLNEAAEQLAERYLELKQQQLERSIDPSQYGDEMRRVKHFITTRNVYGVDLNPTAIELGSLSLWLGSIHRLLQKKGASGVKDIFQPGATPWFGLRLRSGNSLIGARRAVWTKRQLQLGHHVGNSGESPRLLMPGEKRSANEIYHFLVFDEEMAPAHNHSLMRQLLPERCAKAKEWIKNQVKPRWSDIETEDAIGICDLIDRHWESYGEERACALEDTACTATVWPSPSNNDNAKEKGPSLEKQEQIKSQLESTSSSFQRLKLIMDTWCALWFWPLDRITDLPSRVGFLAAARLLLGDQAPDAKLRQMFSVRLGFEIDALLAASLSRVPDTTMLAEAVPWLAVAQELTAEQHFHHWELMFSEILGPLPAAEGFDLVLGNPPWIRVTWTEAVVLSEIEPLLGVREVRTAEYNSKLGELLLSAETKNFFMGKLVKLLGSVTFLNSPKLFAELAGMKANLYKNFIVKGWSLVCSRGIVGFLHPEGPYDDANGGRFRTAIYPRLKAHYHHKNELSLFPDVHHETEYSINIYGGEPSSIQFKNMSNLFHPQTIGASIAHDQVNEPVPGIKTDDNRWNIRPHCNRVVTITQADLEVFANLLDEAGTPASEARLLQIHAKEVLAVVRKIAQAPKRLEDLAGQYFPTVMFDEYQAQLDGIITREDAPSFMPEVPLEWVVSGPHIFVGTPFNKSARTNCIHNNAYDEIDLTEIPPNFVPRAPYRPGNKIANNLQFNLATEKFKLSGNSVVQYYRYANREMVSIGTERSLISAIIPAGPTHINTVFALSFCDHRALLTFSGAALSLCYDFVIKMAGRGHCGHGATSKLPFLESDCVQALVYRTLRLNCLSQAYEELWTKTADDSIRKESWTSDDPRLRQEFELPWNELSTASWDWKTPLRSDFSRRQALVEIDVLVAMSLGVKVEELLTIYRVQFPVMRQYELVDQYDARGRHVPNTARKNQGGTAFRAAFEEWKALGNDPLDPAAPPLNVSWKIDDGLQTVTKTFYAPFTKVSREADYIRAYEAFQERYGGIS